MSKPSRSWPWRLRHNLTVLLILTGMAVLANGAQAVGPVSFTLQGSVLISGGTPATDATVVAIQAGQSPISDATDTSGAYSLSLGDGSWGITVTPPAAIFPQPSPTWIYTGGVELVNSAAPPNRLDLTVAMASATITGQLVVPVGTPSALTPFGNGNRAWVRAHNQEGQGNTVQVNPLNGNFSINVLPGNTKLQLVLENQNWAPPPTLQGAIYTIDAGQTASAGQLQLVEKQAKISGIVRNESGVGVANIPVRAWRLDGAEFQETTSTLGGQYTMNVISGTWALRAVPPADSGYVAAEPPQRVTLASETATAALDLHVVTADVIITGRIVDANGATISAASGRAFALYRNGDQWPQLGPGAAVVNGQFSLRLSTLVATTYRIGAILQPNGGYTSLAAPEVHVTAGTQNVTIPAVAHNSTISGHFNDHDTGQPKTGIPGTVGAISDSAGVAFTTVNTLNGSYQLAVAATNLSGSGGSFWRLRGFVDPTTGYFVQHPRHQRVFLPYNNGNPTNLTGVDFTVTRINAEITGKVTNPQGQPIPGARVSVHEQNALSDSGFDRWGLARLDGSYRIRVPAGTFQVQAAFHDLIAPTPKIVTVTSGGTVGDVNLQFRAKDAVIAGRVTYNSAGHSAFVRAYSDTGAHAYTVAGSQGFYVLPVNSGDTWHVQAVSEVISATGTLTETIFLKSARSDVVTHTGPPPSQLNLALEPSSRLPDGLALNVDTAQLQTLTLSDGSQIIIPAGALANSGTALVVARPLPELADDGGVEPVSFGYRILAFDANQVPITQFNTPVTIVLPFTAEQLSALGITADQLVPSYWDEATSSWKPVENVVVETDESGNGVVRIQVEHFTDYALMSINDQHLLFLPLIQR